MKNIYVGNIAYAVSEEDLRSTFAEFGEVESVRIISDRDTGRSKGFGFVEMSTEEEADAAIQSLDGAELSGRPLKVNKAKNDRPNRSGARF